MRQFEKKGAPLNFKIFSSAGTTALWGCCQDEHGDMLKTDTPAKAAAGRRQEPTAAARSGGASPEAKALLDWARAVAHATNVYDVLTDLNRHILAYFGADVVQLFSYDAVGNEVFTRILLNDAWAEVKFPVTEASVAGYTAFHRQVVALDDVRDPAALAAYPGIRYDPRFENRTGVRVRAIVSAPIVTDDDTLLGIIQLINTQRPAGSYGGDIDLLVQLGRTVAEAVFHQTPEHRRATPYDLLLEEGTLAPDDLQRALRMAREHPGDPLKGDPVAILMDVHGVPESDMAASLSRYYLTDFYAFEVDLNLRPEPFDFARAMRSFLRADPDIIMVGEMRDKETATIAIEASLTGHLVLSTLHTNSAPETITRLVEMGIDPLNVADSLLGILAQRLVRVLCPDCKEAYAPEPGEIDALKVACGREHAAACHLEDPVETLYRPVGWGKCSKLGYRGRAGIHELLHGTPGVKATITAGKAMTAIRDQAMADGMATLKMDGIRRVVAGQTTLAEVLKVCID